MRNKIILNVFMNLVLTLFFVILNINSLQAGLEETFISLAIAFGILVIMFNSLFLYFLKP